MVEIKPQFLKFFKEMESSGVADAAPENVIVITQRPNENDPIFKDDVKASEL